MCADALNPAGRPTSQQLWSLNHRYPGVRLVLFDDIRFYGYYDRLRDGAVDVAVLLVDESVDGSDYGTKALRFATVLAAKPPLLWIIGNEPNNEGPSSQPKTPDEYVAMWTAATSSIKSVIPSAVFVVAGQLGAPDWLTEVFPRLEPVPDMVDVHYPETEEALLAYQQFGVPLVVMEWAWAGQDVKGQQVVSWQQMLSRHTAHSCWFCWSDGMVAGMGLVRPQGRTKPEYLRYRAALAASGR